MIFVFRIPYKYREHNSTLGKKNLISCCYDYLQLLLAQKLKLMV